MLFPHDQKLLVQRLKVLLNWLAKEAILRSMSDTHVSYGTLMKYRNALLFWVRRVYTRRAAEDASIIVPKRDVIFDQLTEVLRAQRG